MEERLPFPKQNKCIAKMLGYDYEIIYKRGRDNVIADALSRQYEDASSLLALYVPITRWLETTRQEWLTDPHTT